ncbi:MAG: hypothetical protein Q6366_002510 [Candidatus Freyarchaeota archaeon]
MTYSDQRRKGDGKLKRKESPAQKEKNQRANEHIKRKTLKNSREKLKNSKGETAVYSVSLFSSITSSYSHPKK